MVALVSYFAHTTIVISTRWERKLSVLDVSRISCMEAYLTFSMTNADEGRPYVLTFLPESPNISMAYIPCLRM